ncbi:uncharacterized protein [Solanum lycopersicum]|uniref:uncharacterized protein n=1 Tax=Solanum lycopersicum TaxID=4081 RepID=UPI0037478560
MDKGKNVQTELTEEELRRKIERVTREIQKVKEEGLKVDVTTAIYKVAVTTLDEDLASQIKRKKEVEMETESLRKRLNLLRLEIHEGKAREAKIDIETAVLLNRSAALDEELATHSDPKGGKYLARDQGADNSGLGREVIEEDDEEEIVYKPPFPTLADHPYFTRSKGPTDSFPRSNSDKGKTVMGDNNDEGRLTDVVVAQPTVVEQNELIMQLMQQIAEMKNEMQRRQDAPPPGFGTNIADARPPVYFPSSNIDPTQNQPSTPVHNPSVIDLTTQNPQYASASYQTPSPLPNNHPQIPPHPQNTQTAPPPQNQNQTQTAFNTQAFHPHLSQNTNPQAYPQNYQTAQNVSSPSIAPPLPKRATFQVPVPAEHEVHGSELDHYEEQEKEWKAKEEVKIDIKEEIKRAMKELQCIPDAAGLSYAELCIHPDLNLPEGFKIPKFDTFGGVGNPMAHLRAYCDQLVGVGRDEALLMRLFSRSLCGEALEWFTSHETRQWPSWNALAKDFIDRFAYNVEIVPDRYSLEKMKQKPTESYREFAYRWRKEAARVRPPMTEKEIMEVFVRVQEPEYYDRIMLLVGAKFAEIVKVGKTIEDGLKSGKIARVSASPGSSGLIRKRREEVAAVSQTLIPGAKLLVQDTQNYQRVPPPRQSGYDTSRPRFEKKPSRKFTTLAESRTKLFERLVADGYIHPVGPRPVDVNSKFYRPDQRCAYHSNSVGHDTEDCINLKHKIQDLIDQEVVSLQPAVPNVNTNPLPNHGGDNLNMIETDEDGCGTKMITPIVHEDLERAVASLSVKERREFVILTPAKAVALVPSKTLIKPKFVIETAVAQGMTRSGRCYTPDELALGGQKKDHAKRPISEGEAEEFWRRMQPKDYSIVKHLEKTPAQISVWALLMSSQSHRQALMKALDDTYVPSGTSSDNVAAMIHQVIRGHRISFCDDELPVEGRSHNKALHITVICRGKVVNCVLVDDGSGLNICPLTTLRQLNFDLGKLEQNQVNVRAFDGVQRYTLGAVTLTLQMGPAEFSVQFQVLDIDTSYNLLLGRPFIHMAGAVPSTLHQMMKLVWKNEELVIHGEGSRSGKQVSVIDETPQGADFYTVELVNATNEDLALNSMPTVYKMIATVMLQNGFEPGFGLGRDSQGIIEPVPVLAQGSKYGLGYIPTDDDRKRRRDQELTKPIPHLYHSFPVREHAEPEDGGEGICDLFKEINTVIEEEAESAGFRDAEPGEMLKNWTSTPILMSRTLGNVSYKPANVMSCHELNEQNEVNDDEADDYDEESGEPDYVVEEFRQFENQHKPNLKETETVNLGDSECVKEVKISTHLNETQKESLIHLLAEYSDVFVWEVSDMQGLSTDVVSHKLPINPGFEPVKQRTRKFKPELSLKIKEEITKQIESRLVEVTQYPTWLANVVPVAKKDGKIRICIDYRDLNKASPKDNFPLPNIHILIDNCAKHEMQSFVDCYAGYHQILMDEEDTEKMAFITPWGVYHYRVMPFGLKNAGATYMRAMTTIFHDMIHKEIEVYVDDVIIKSRESSDHLTHLRKFFERLRRYNLKLNPAKCAFGVPAGKLLGFIVSRRGIELDPSKIKAIQELPPPKTRKEVMSFLGRLNYISWFIAQSTVVCEPIFKLLKKDAPTKWTEECQTAFDAIKSYLSNPPVLVPPREGSPLLLYLSVSDNAFGCVLGQHDETGKKEKAIYYISKKFTPYESRYTLLERTCCALTWLAQKLRHYLSSYTTYLISRMDPLKYIFQKAMPTGKLAKWQMLLSEFDIVYVTQKAIKAQALADHLAENPINEEYEPLKTYFHDEEVSFVGEDISIDYPGWRLFFDGAVNHQGKGVGAVLVSESGQHYPMAAKLRFNCTNNMAEYEVCILGLKMVVDMNVYELLVIGDSDLLIHQVQGEWAVKNPKIVPYVQYVQNLCKRFRKIEFRHTPRIQNELADALATIASMIKHPDTDYIDPLDIDLKEHPIHCSHVESEPDGLPWYFDIKRRTPDLGLLRCVDAAEAVRLIEQIHAGVCGTHMNGLTLARKVLRAGYFWMTMENDCCKFVQKCHKCQVHGDLIRVPPHELNAMSSPWPFVAWGMDVIDPIEPAASNGHRFILVAIDYFTKWVEATSYKLVTKKVVADFVRNNLICRFGVPESIITDNEAVVPVEVEIPSLRIIQDAELSNAEWVSKRIDQLALIDEKRMVYSFASKSAEFFRRMNTEKEKTISKASDFIESKKHFISFMPRCL